MFPCAKREYLRLRRCGLLSLLLLLLLLPSNWHLHSHVRACLASPQLTSYIYCCKNCDRRQTAFYWFMSEWVEGERRGEGEQWLIDDWLWYLQFKYSQKSKKRNQRDQVNVYRDRQRERERWGREQETDSSLNKKLLIDVRDVVGAVVLCDLYRNLYRAHSNWTIWAWDRSERRGKRRDDYGISWGLAHVCISRTVERNPKKHMIVKIKRITKNPNKIANKTT